MIGILSPFFEPLEVKDYRYDKTKDGSEFRILFENGYFIAGKNGSISFYSDYGHFEIVDRQLYRWIVEILHSPSSKFLPHLISAAVKLFAINNGLIDYDFTDHAVRDLINFLER